MDGERDEEIDVWMDGWIDGGNDKEGGRVDKWMEDKKAARRTNR